MATNVAGIIQARMGSARLPGKSLLEIAGQTTIERVWRRCLRSTKLVETYVAVPNNQENEMLADHCKKIGAQCFKGDPDNVLLRITDAANHFDVDVVVRITGDNPFVGADVIDFMVNRHFGAGAHFSSGYHSKSFPNGTVVSVINTEVLSFLQTINDERVNEHIILNMDCLKGRFQSQIVEAPPKWSRYDLRYCLDNDEDLIVLRTMAEFFNKAGKAPSTTDIIQYLDEHEGVRKINKKYAIQGY